MANMNQTPLELCFNTTSARYSATGEKQFGVEQMGMDKMRNSVHFNLLLDRDGSYTIHKRNIQTLAFEIF